MDEFNDLMTMKEMVKYIRTNRFTLMKWIHKEYIPASKIGHRWFFSKRDVDEFIKNRKKGGDK